MPIRDSIPCKEKEMQDLNAEEKGKILITIERLILYK